MLGHQTPAPDARGFWIDRGRRPRGHRAIVADFDVRTPGIDVPARALSGGNQQKLIVGREMSGDPTAADRVAPDARHRRGCAGGDLGPPARARARRAGRPARSRADLDELIGLSDTLLRDPAGPDRRHADPATVTPEELGSAMTGAGSGVTCAVGGHRGPRPAGHETDATGDAASGRPGGRQE